MRLWIDTEFIEDGHTIELISVGAVAEDGRELYLCNADCDLSRANRWVQAHVLPKLPTKPVMSPFQPEATVETNLPIGLINNQLETRETVINDCLQTEDSALLSDTEGTVVDLTADSRTWVSKRQLKKQLHSFIKAGLAQDGQADKPVEMWMWRGAYDWVALCQLFGKMGYKPTGWPKHYFELYQVWILQGSPELPRLEKTVSHNALVDARWVKQAWEVLHKIG